MACNSLTQSRLRVFPIFAKDVFLEVLSELDIETHQTSFEADEVIKLEIIFIYYQMLAR